MNNVIEKDLLLILGILAICLLSVFGDVNTGAKDVLLLALGLFGGALKGKT